MFRRKNRKAATIPADLPWADGVRVAIHDAQMDAQERRREPNDVDLLHALLKRAHTPATDSLEQLQVNVSEVLKAIDRYRAQSSFRDTDVQPLEVIIREAQEAARRLHWKAIGVEHLLLGLRAGGTDVKRLLGSGPDDADSILDGVEAVLQRWYSDATIQVDHIAKQEHEFVLSPGEPEWVTLIDERASGCAIITVLEAHPGQVHIRVDAPESWLVLPTKKLFSPPGD